MIFWLEWKINLNVLYSVLFLWWKVTSQPGLSQSSDKGTVNTSYSSPSHSALLIWRNNEEWIWFGRQMFSINFTWGRSSSMGSSGSMLAKVTLLSLLCLSSFLGVQSGQSDRELTAAGGQLSTSSPTPNLQASFLLVNFLFNYHL